ncbi:hypothetical protein SAMN05880590_10115 [Rhizobium sp. RU35A]|uniref:hypothetical protein n=1 Tax=Rhizobium sp. RU35A TaxID=1907414 RepID=UPI000954D4FB|nr:hypothetical protein [Rhizobium sp. RU35A]SIP88989.1 hypothetical protein SAMN05880590_10115 [Rhizobium sp. RU35A]
MILPEDMPRADRIEALLVQEFRADGYVVISAEDGNYARVVALDDDRAILMADINLTTLARQIDRGMK